ncbi:hypothetical protein [Lebetimonas sp. JH369]|uniref:hypothetical protein n=1 Tax=Lebetimonas sp. JH369 TaxID=990069 RepID=UPI0004669D1F|nr:hypothetical protein [Lebetimonas sp. JH369]
MKRIVYLLIFFNFIFASECGIFTNVLQTRKDGSKIDSSSGSSYIYNSPSCTLITPEIKNGNFWSSNALRCEKEDGSEEKAKASGTTAKGLNDSEIFTWEFHNSQATKNVGGGDSYEITQNNEVLTKNKYNVVSQDSNHYDFTWSPNGNNIGVYKFDSIIGTVTIANVSGKDVKIGQFITASYDDTKLIFNETPNKIEIGKLSVTGSNSFSSNFEANDAIDITEFDVTSSVNDTVTLKAPIVRITKENNNKMNLQNNNNHIVIYADELYIGEIDFGQNNTLVIHPFTPGHKVDVHIRQINFSSSSSIIMDSGDYHIKDVDIPDSGDNDVLFKASDENQVINLILDPASENHDFEIGSNYGINSNGTGGDFGDYNPANFRIFVHGDMSIGNGNSNSGTTINALVYVTGEVDIGSSTYVRGAISSYDDITIGDGSKFYWDDRIDFSDYGKCVNYQNHYVCGIFPTPLNSYTHITANGNNPRACFTTKIAYPEGELDGNIKCNPQECDNGGNTCERENPPLNKYTYTFSINKHSGINEDTSITELQDEYYGNFDKFNQKIVRFNPQYTYDNNNHIKVMVLGNVKVEKSTLQFEPGDYYFDSLTIENNNNNIVLNGGPVRIFIKKDFNVSLNNFHLNSLNSDGSDGNASNLFIYVGGDFNSLGNGGGTTTLKGFIYVKGNTYLKNNSNNWKIYGSLTTEGTITIEGNNPDFIGGSDADDLGYGECSMCYDTPKVNGMSFNLGSCPGFSINMGSSIYVPIQSSDSLENVVIDEAHKKSIFSFSMFNTNKVKDQDGNDVRDANQNDNGLLNVSALGLDTSLFDDKVVSYQLGDNNGNYGPTNDGNYQQLYTYTLFGFDFCKWYQSLTYVAHYEKDGKHYDSLVGACATNNEEHYETGYFDAWDVNGNINDRNITTKIVNQKFNLTIASINPDNNATEKGKEGKECYYRLYDMNNNKPITSWREFNASNLSTKQDKFNVSKAVRNVRVQFKFCQKKGQYPVVIEPLSNCVNDSKNYEYNTSTFSSDNFAIRPYAFRVFGNNQYKRAGEDFNITIKAVDENNNSINSGTVDDVKGVKDYNVSLNDLNINSKFYIPTDEETRQMNVDVYGIDDTNKSRVAYCPDPGVFSVVGNPSFNNGEVNATLQFSESGILEINVSEKPGNEFAKVDEKDTPDSQRYINSATIIYDINDINKTDLLMFIPYKFVTDGEYLTIPGNPNNWVYMSNEVNKSNTTYQIPKMAAYIKYIIKAENKNGDVVKNYTKTCFPDVDEANAPRRNGLKLNTTFDLFLDSDLNITKNATISAYTADNYDTAVWTPNKKINLTDGNNSLQEWIGATNFENGEGNAKVYFNINKNYKIPVNEINITINDINTSTSWMNNPGATNKFIGKDINKTIKFLYGRIKVNDATGIGREINTTFKYEYWDKNKGWVENKEHNDTFGKVYFDKSYINTTKLSDSKISANEHNIVNGEQNITFLTTHSLPYGAKIHLSIPSWLWYHPLAKPYKDPSSSNLECLTHPCMKVNFLTNSTGWGGISSNAVGNKFNESNRTSKVGTSEKNVSKKEVKKLNW